MVRAGRSWLGQDVVARLRAEALLGSVDLDPPGLPDRSVLVLRRVTWRAGRQLAETARATVGELRRTAVRPAHSAALGPAADAVLFADDAELLACLTRDALAGQLTRWYWRQLAPAAPSRLGAVLAAAWTARARWLPAALAALPARDAVRAVSTLTPGEAAAVRQAMLAEFAGPGAPPPGPGEPGQPDAVAPCPETTTVSSGITAVGGARPAVGDRTAGADGEPPATGDARPPAPWAQWLGASQSLQPEQEALLGTAVALDTRPAVARRPAFVAQVTAWLHAASRSAAAAPTVPVGQGRAARAAAAPPMTSPARGAASAGAVAHIVAPDSRGDTETGLAPALQIPTRQEAPVAPGPDTAAEPGTGWPTTATTVAGSVVSQVASVMYLVNVLCWLDLPAAWPEGAAPGGWAILELLARHLLTAEAAPPDDPLWAVLAELDGRAPGTPAEAGVGADDPVRLPTAWLRRWAPQEASWGWAEARGRMTMADQQHGYVVADVPCTPGHGGTAAATELARLRAAGVTGSLCPAPLRLVAASNPPGWSRRHAAVGQFVAWLLASREVPPSALAQPGRIALTRTHVDVVLDLERVDLAARACGLDRDPGWVPDLGRIVLFHFEAGG
jgi:hypothetical protein